MLRGMLLTMGLLAAAASGRAADRADRIDFRRDIRPILSDNCFLCHGPDAGTREADLRLDTHAGALTVLTPHDSDASELVQRITSSDPDQRMPPPGFNRTLSDRQIQLLRRWVEQGAAWDEHWSFAPLRKPAVPAVVSTDSDAPASNSRGDSLRNPIDAFVQAKLARHSLPPAPEAARETLLRRVTLDLTGLPPTIEELSEFLADSEPDAYERLVDRLLQSPAFGERMAWDWLDAARYADSNGYQGDGERTMWPWRDWVARAFNVNLPFDQFTVWQLAGDRLPDATHEQKLATGFARNHMINGEGGRIAEENRIEYVMDMTETMGTVWLGLTLNCCRCHDHKFDPLTQQDYYRLFAFFNQTPVNGGGGSPQTPPVLAAPTADQAAEIEAVEAALRELAAGTDASDDSSDEQLQKQRKELDERLKALQNAVAKVMVMEDMPSPRQTFMLDRGLYNKPGEEVSASTPAHLLPLPAEQPHDRLGLARWLVADDNPLTARVTVNRLWQQLFGIGLVKTTEDFGAQSEIPPQLELLDWLAAEFRGSGWDVKQLLRLIVTSHTYRQSSRLVEEQVVEDDGSGVRGDAAPAASVDMDPENRLLARGPRYRLASWMLRDQALAASGLLVAQHGGPAVKGYQPPGVWEEATFGNKRYQQDHGAALYRRSLYTFWRRIIGPTVFFDNAARQVCTVKPFRTNTPLHALLTLNDVTYVEAARTLAAATLTDVLADEEVAGQAAEPMAEQPEALDQLRLDFAFRRLLCRPATPEERAVLLAGLQRTRKAFASAPGSANDLLAVGEMPREEQLDPVEHASWTALCLALLNLDETLTKE